MTLEDKLRMAAKLDDMGIDYIEGGWPGSNPRDADFFKQVKKLKLQACQDRSLRDDATSRRQAVARISISRLSSAPIRRR